MFFFLAPPGGLEPPSLAPEANALSTELWGLLQLLPGSVLTIGARILPRDRWNK